MPEPATLLCAPPSITFNFLKIILFSWPTGSVISVCMCRYVSVLVSELVMHQNDIQWHDLRAEFLQTPHLVCRSREQISAGFEILTQLITNSILWDVSFTRSSATFRGNVQPPSSGKWGAQREEAAAERFYLLPWCLLFIGCFSFPSKLKIDIVFSFETSVSLYRITWFHIPLDIFMFLRKQRRRSILNCEVYLAVSLVFWRGKRDWLNYNCLRSVIYALCISVDCNINLPHFGVARIVMNRVCSLEIILRGAPCPSRYIQGVLKSTFSKYTDIATTDRQECCCNDSVHACFS
jgi:hypothetical protein